MTQETNSTSWTSFLSSIRSDLAELRTSVSEGANDILNYVKEAIPEETENPQDPSTEAKAAASSEAKQTEEQPESTPTATESLSSLFSGFLSSAINKTKNAIQEVLEEANAGEQDSEETDDKEIFRVMSTDASTYTTIGEDEKEAFANWMSRRDKVYLHSLKMQLMEDHPIIQVMYRRLVPNVVSDTAFWNNFFFHMDQKGYPFDTASNREEVKEAVPVDTTNSEVFKEGSCGIRFLRVEELEAMKEGWSDVDLSEGLDLKEDELKEVVEDVGGAIDNDDIKDDDWGDWE